LTPFLEAVRTFPSAVNLHLSPATMAGVKGKTRLKPPSVVIL
jgi:hypothetical protein